MQTLFKATLGKSMKYSKSSILRLTFYSAALIPDQTPGLGKGKNWCGRVMFDLGPAPSAANRKLRFDVGWGIGLEAQSVKRAYAVVYLSHQIFRMPAGIR